MDFDNIISEIEKYFSTFSEVFSQHKDITFFVSDVDYYTRKIRAGDEVREERFVEIDISRSEMKFNSGLRDKMI